MKKTLFNITTIAILQFIFMPTAVALSETVPPADFYSVFGRVTQIIKGTVSKVTISSVPPVGNEYYSLPLKTDQELIAFCKEKNGYIPRKQANIHIDNYVPIVAHPNSKQIYYFKKSIIYFYVSDICRSPTFINLTGNNLAFLISGSPTNLSNGYYLTTSFDITVGSINYKDAPNGWKKNIADPSLDFMQPVESAVELIRILKLPKD